VTGFVTRLTNFVTRPTGRTAHYFTRAGDRFSARARDPRGRAL